MKRLLTLPALIGTVRLPVSFVNDGLCDSHKVQRLTALERNPT